MKPMSAFSRVALGIGLCILALATGGAMRIVQDTCGPFTDVTPGFCPYVLELYYLGITVGTSATTFSPDQPLTRGQAAVFVSKGLNQSLARSSRRAALGQWWTTTPHYDLGLGVTSVGSNPLAVACDGQDVWTANRDDSSVSRVRASDGKLLETWTGADTAVAILVAMGRVFVLGNPQDAVGKLYVLDPSQPAGAATLVSESIGGGSWALAFDGTNFWVIFRGNPTEPGGGLAIVHPGPSYPWTSTIIKTNIVDPEAMIFDGQNIWIGDSGDVSLKKLDAAGAVIQTVPLTHGPINLGFDGSNIWVTSGVPDITVVSASTGSVLATLTGNGLGAGQIAFDGSRILVTNGISGSVSIWRAADLAPLGSFYVSSANFPLAVASDGINFWVTLYYNQLARF